MELKYIHCMIFHENFNIRTYARAKKWAYFCHKKD